MPINITCSCGQKLAVKDQLAGRTVKCPKCGKPLKVAGEKPSAAKTSPTSKDAPRRQGSAARDEDEGPLADLLDEVGLTASRTGRRCPQCGSDMIPEAIICIECGFNTETGRRLRTKRDIIDGRK